MPPGCVTTLSDPQGRPTVAQYLAGVKERLFPVGRLDWDAEGALLLTDDGETANKLMHPRFQVERTYLAKVKGDVSDATLERLRGGVRLEDGPATPKVAERYDRAEKNTWLKLVLTEGRQHLVKRLCAAVGHPVVRLFRPAHAGIGLKGLPPGRARKLSRDEVAVVETNRPESVLLSQFIVLGVVTGASLVMSAYCLANQKTCFGSCPTFYLSPTDDAPRAEGFSMSVAKVLEASDVDSLSLTSQGKTGFDLWMKNEALETHVVRHVRLLAARRPAGGRVFATVGAEFLEATDLRLDRVSHRVWLNAEELALTPKSVMLLEYMMTHPDELVSRERLLDEGLDDRGRRDLGGNEVALGGRRGVFQARGLGPRVRVDELEVGIEREAEQYDVGDAGGLGLGRHASHDGAARPAAAAEKGAVPGPFNRTQEKQDSSHGR